MKTIRPESLAFILLLSALGALPPLSIDAALPALAPIGTTFGRATTEAALTLSWFMAGFSVAQLAFGPLSERFGRRPVLLGGIALFSITSLACAAAPSLAWLLTMRCLEGCGAGAGMVMVFAIVRDLFDEAQGRSRLSYVTAVLSVAPLVAPLLGAGLLSLGSWRLIYGALGVAGLLLLAVLWLGLAESLRHPDPQALAPSQLTRRYGLVLRTPACIGYILINGLNFGCMFAYVAGSAFVMIELLGLTPSAYGLTFAATAGGIILGSFISGRLGSRGVTAQHLLDLGTWGAALGSALTLGLGLWAPLSLATLLPALVFTTFCYGLVGPNAAYCALRPMGHNAGAASAVLGFGQMGCGAVASWAVATFSDGHSPLSMSVTMLVCAGLAAVLHGVWLRPMHIAPASTEATQRT